MGSAALSDKLTPVTWWIVGVTFALLASLTTDPRILLLLCVAALVGTALLARRKLRNQALRLYGITALFVLLIRVGFRLIFNIPALQGAWLRLPLVELRVFNLPISLFGPVSLQSIMAGLTDGLRLAAIILAVGFAASVANPRKLIRSAPAVLYEFATATTIAINVAPQLITSLNRVRRARSLRGNRAGLKGLGAILIPVLEDTVQRSLDLAASMDARGFGRRGAMRLRVVYSARAAAGIGVMLLAVSCYLILASGFSVGLGLAAFGLGLACVAVSARLAGMYRVRTRLALARPAVWDWSVRLICLTLTLTFAIVAYAPGASVLEWHP